MRFHVCDSASVSGLCLMALYFAPIDAASNSGRFSSQTFRTSSLIVGRTFLDAERKAFVRAIEFDLSPRGDDWICRTFIERGSSTIKGVTNDRTTRTGMAWSAIITGRAETNMQL